jgi:manganese-dependent inorganic pyrophosphatase
VEDGQAVVIVDTNNPAELPANINRARHPRHHRPPQDRPRIETKSPIEVTIRPVACTRR